MGMCAILGGLGVPEILIIALVAFVLLIVFGPKNLPKLGNSIGKALKGLRKGLSGDDEEDKKAADEVVVETEEVEEEKPKTTKKSAKKSNAKKAPSKKVSDKQKK